MDGMEQKVKLIYFIGTIILAHG